MQTITYPFNVPLITDWDELHLWAHKFSLAVMKSGCSDEYTMRNQGNRNLKLAQAKVSKIAERAVCEWFQTIGLPYQYDAAIYNKRQKSWNPDFTGDGLIPLSAKNYHGTVDEVSWIVNIKSFNGGGKDVEFFKHPCVGTHVSLKNKTVTILMIAHPSELMNAMGPPVLEHLRETKLAIYLDKMNPANFISDLSELVACHSSDTLAAKVN